MKIESKFKDYYDSGLVYGIDEKVYFKRESTQQDISGFRDGEFFSFFNGTEKYDIKLYPGVIGFCGNVYPFYRIEIEKHIHGTIDIINEFAYSYDEFEQKIEELGCKIIVKNNVYGWKGRKGKILVYKNEVIDLRIYNIENFYGDVFDSDYLDIFKQSKVAYFIIETYKLSYITYKNMNYAYETWDSRRILYPILKDYKFSKIIDSYTAFQEISMYLGNLNNPDENMLKPDDKYVAYSKGFCCHSFRKKATKKKIKNCSAKKEVD